MQASIKTKKDGSVAVRLDGKPARALFASVLFASRFHEGIAPLAGLAEEALRRGDCLLVRRKDLCQ